jgi:predicted HicB family RNase H-like nuclease
MGKLAREDFLRKVEATPVVEPDKWDIEMLAEIDNEADDDSVATLEDIRARRECNGEISIRVPKELHYKLLENAKENGVSLSQFIIYKLAKP